MFNAEEFMNAVYTEATSTRIPVLPVGRYTGVIRFPETPIASGTSERTGQPWWRLDLFLDIVTPIEYAKRSVRTGIMLDINERGLLDNSEDRNIRLGRLREAAGLNDPKVPFKLRDLEGRIVAFQLDHRVDASDPTRVYEDVKGFFKP